jgi:hypothetical protein
MSFVIVVLLIWLVLWTLSAAGYYGPSGYEGYCNSPAHG